MRWDGGAGIASPHTPHPLQRKHSKALKEPAAANGYFSSQWNILQEDVKTKEAIKKRAAVLRRMG